MQSPDEKPVDGRSVEETLDAVESIWLASLEGNCEIFQLAAHYAHICNGDGLPRSRRVLPGTERAVQFGGQGTPRVAEFAATEFGARMRMGTVGARHLIADALDAHHRLPKLWARVCAREVRVPWVRYVASKTRHLSREAAARVDADMAESADGRIPWARFCARLEGRIVAADPEAARRREEERRQAVFANATQSSEGGMKGFFLRGPTAWVLRLDATVAYLAEALRALGDTDDEDHRRVKACLVLANPTQAVELLAAFAAFKSRNGRPADADAEPPDDEDDPFPEDDGPVPEGQESSEEVEADPLVPRVFRPVELPGWLARACDPDTSRLLDWPRLLPRVCLYLHVAGETAESAEGGVARWEGQEPVTWQYVRDVLAPYHSFTVTEVVDLAGQEPVDAYEIPQRHRRAVRLRTPADCFPFSSNLAANLDVDHTQAYEHAGEGEPLPAGQSRMDNYGPLGRFNHRVKTHGRWQVAQPFDGIYVWRDPHGEFYLVDHTGTRKVTGRTPPRRKVLSLVLHHSDVRVDYDGPAHCAA